MDGSSNIGYDNDEGVDLPSVVLSACMSGLYLVASSMWAVLGNWSWQ